MDSHSLSDALDASARAVAIAAIHGHCAVYTQPSLAASILDRVGWIERADLRAQSLLEPAAGDGAFVLPAVDRLVASANEHNFFSEAHLRDRLRAFEFDPRTALNLQMQVLERLADAGMNKSVAQRLSFTWVKSEDFLTTKFKQRFTHIVGNPPYMRWSKLPESLRRTYEANILPAYATKGDLCLAFVCKSVELMHETEGLLAFLCADRWLRCAYGEAARKSLRKKVRIADYIEAHGLPVFNTRRKVSAYAAVTILDRRSNGGTRVRSPKTLRQMRAILRANPTSQPATHNSLLREEGGALICSAGLQRALIETAILPTLSIAGVSVRCGMALGRAEAFVVDPDAPIELDRLVPFVRSEDLLESGETTSPKRLASPWAENGELIDLRDYPRLAAHFAPYRSALLNRTCVRSADQWHRTIDRPHSRRDAERILVAGMARRSRVAIAGEGEQPGNALYVLRSSQWPVAMLFAVLRSGLLDLYGAALAPTFSGTSKRFDGNVLRQVRIPIWSSVSASIKADLEKVDLGVAAPRPDLLCDLLGIGGQGPRVAVRRVLKEAWSVAS